MRTKTSLTKLYKEKRVMEQLETLVLDSGICFGTFLFVFILFNMVIK